MELNPPIPKKAGLRELFRFLRDNDVRTILRALHSRDVHPFIQFFKYAVCGVAALAVQTAVFVLLANHYGMDLHDNTGDHSVRANQALSYSGIAFIFSNAAAYWMNHLWVFTPGAHSRTKEFLLFTIVNAPGAICGAVVQDWLIRSAGWPAWAAFTGFVIPNVLVNFACRKAFIFKK